VTHRLHETQQRPTPRLTTIDSPLRPFLTGALIACCLLNPSMNRHALGSGGGGTGGGTGGGPPPHTLGPPGMAVSQPCSTPVGSGAGQGASPPGQGAPPPAASPQSASGCGCSGGCSGGGGSGGGACPITPDATIGRLNPGCCPWNPASNAVTSAATSPQPVFYHWGSAYERVADLSLSAPGVQWSMTRSYVDGDVFQGGVTTQGNQWMNSATDKLLYGGISGSIYVDLDMASARQFYASGSAWALSPQDGFSTLTTDSAHNQYIFADQVSNLRYTFNNLSVSPGPGRIKEESTLQLPRPTGAFPNCAA
jgi:hypothetical protein